MVGPSRDQVNIKLISRTGSSGRESVNKNGPLVDDKKWSVSRNEKGRYSLGF